MATFDPNVFDPAVFDAGEAVDSRPLPTGTVVAVVGASLAVLVPGPTLRTVVVGELQTA